MQTWENLKGTLGPKVSNGHKDVSSQVLWQTDCWPVASLLQSWNYPPRHSGSTGAYAHLGTWLLCAHLARVHTWFRASAFETLFTSFPFSVVNPFVYVMLGTQKPGPYARQVSTPPLNGILSPEARIFKTPTKSWTIGSAEKLVLPAEKISVGLADPISLKNSIIVYCKHWNVYGYNKDRRRHRLLQYTKVHLFISFFFTFWSVLKAK